MDHDESAANPYQTPQSASLPPANPGTGPLLKNPTALAWWACGLYLMTQLATLVSHLIQTTASTDAINDFESSLSLAYTGSLLLAFAFLVASGVVFLCWKYRAAHNAKALDPLLAVSPAMAVGGYFIPFANLVIPYRAMASITRATRAGEGMVGLWWALHLITSFLSIAVVNTASEDELIRPPEDIEHLSVGLDLINAVVGILLVVKVTRAQAALFRGQFEG